VHLKIQQAYSLSYRPRRGSSPQRATHGCAVVVYHSKMLMTNRVRLRDLLVKKNYASNRHVKKKVILPQYLPSPYFGPCRCIMQTRH
jgi:hypothetical protein